MGHIFYFYVLLVTFILISTISRFFKIKNIQEWYHKFHQITGKKPEKEDFRSEDEFNTFSASFILPVIEISIIIGGLLTKSWIIFLLIFVSTISLNMVIKPIQFNFLGKSISLVGKISRIFCYLFLTINHFHLHLDFSSKIMTFFTLS